MKSPCVTHRFGKLIKAEHGQALVLTAVGITMLLLMAGLGVDVGYLHYRKAQMQKAADAGALAGAAALIYRQDYTAAARNDAAANGFINGVKDIAVEVYSPPQLSPAYRGKDNYIEVLITQPRPTFFTWVSGFGSVPLRGHSVASVIKSAAGSDYSPLSTPPVGSAALVE